MANITRTRIDCASNPQSSYVVSGLSTDVYKVELYFNSVGLSVRSTPMIQCSTDSGATWYTSAGDYPISGYQRYPGSQYENITGTGFSVSYRYSSDTGQSNFSSYVKLFGVGKSMRSIFRNQSVSQGSTNTLEPYFNQGSTGFQGPITDIRIVPILGSAVFNAGEIIVLVYEETETEIVIHKNFDVTPASSFSTTVFDSTCDIEVGWTNIDHRIYLRQSVDAVTWDQGPVYEYQRQAYLLHVKGTNDTFGTFSTSQGFGSDKEGYMDIRNLNAAHPTIWQGAGSGRGGGYKVEQYWGRHNVSEAYNYVQMYQNTGATWTQGDILLVVSGDSTG